MWSAGGTWQWWQQPWPPHQWRRLQQKTAWQDWGKKTNNQNMYFPVVQVNSFGVFFEANKELNVTLIFRELMLLHRSKSFTLRNFLKWKSKFCFHETAQKCSAVWAAGSWSSAHNTGRSCEQSYKESLNEVSTHPENGKKLSRTFLLLLASACLHLWCLWLFYNDATTSQTSLVSCGLNADYKFQGE